MRPEFANDRCVHAHARVASCVACLSACPRDALRLDGPAPELIAERCDGCGLCVVACPRQAITLPLDIGHGEIASQTANFAACQAILQGNSAGGVPCLHAIGLDRLLRAARQGTRVWIVAHGCCASCPRGRGAVLSEVLDPLNAALWSRGELRIVVKAVEVGLWRKLYAAYVRDRSEHTTRRGFLSRWLTAADPDKAHHAKLEGPGPLPWVIALDTERCVACHACVRVCPDQALHFAEAPEPEYRLEHAACSGCGLCRDVCEHDAIRPVGWENPPIDRVPLRADTCTACGAPYHGIRNTGTGGICPVCARWPDRTRPNRHIV